MLMPPPLTSPDCAPVMRVPKGVSKGPTELPPVPLETYHNKSKPRSQQEPRLPSPILRRSPRHHPLSQQANAVLEPFTWPTPPPPDAPYQTHRDTSVPVTPRKVQFAEDTSSPASPTPVADPASPTPVAAQPRPKTIKYADDIVCPSSPTSVTDHPSFQLDDAAMMWFLNGNLPQGVQQVAFKALNPDTGLMADYKVLSKSSDGEHWIEGNCH